MINPTDQIASGTHLWGRQDDAGRLLAGRFSRVCNRLRHAPHIAERAGMSVPASAESKLIEYEQNFWYLSISAAYAK
jgi:hypothetical protein